VSQVRGFGALQTYSLGQRGTVGSYETRISCVWRNYSLRDRPHKCPARLRGESSCHLLYSRPRILPPWYQGHQLGLVPWEPLSLAIFDVQPPDRRQGHHGIGRTMTLGQCLHTAGCQYISPAELLAGWCLGLGHFSIISACPSLSKL